MSTLVLISCNTMCDLSTETRWSLDTDNGQITDRLTHIQWHFTDNPAAEQNASDFSYGARFVTADNYEAYNGRKFVESLVRDLPFRPDSLCWVYADGIMLFENNNSINLHPDYAIQANSVVMNMQGEYFHADTLQPADIVWRNLIIPRGHHRLICVDRFRVGSHNFSLVYVAQSNCSSSQRKHWGLNDWNLLTWDVADPRNMQISASFLDHWSELSAKILKQHLE